MQMPADGFRPFDHGAKPVMARRRNRRREATSIIDDGDEGAAGTLTKHHADLMSIAMATALEIASLTIEST